MARIWAVGLGCLLLFAGSALAQVSPDEHRLVLMNEPLSYMDVIDAADGPDRFDINALVEFSRSVERAQLSRETTSEQGDRLRRKLAESEHVVSRLSLGLDVGLYHDLMAFVRLPLTISDARTLRARGDAGPRLLSDPGDFGGGSGPLFTLPFDSPTRAGFDHIAFGFAYAILSQARARFMPTWLVSLEGRRALGEPMRPCRVDETGERVCGAANTEDIDGDGVEDGTAAELGGGGPGISRGVSALKLDTRVARRFRYAESYAGFGVLVEWPSTAARYFRPGGLSEGMLQASPSRQFSVDIGNALIPWEHRGRFQRVAIDLRANATYFSGGREYSALYDALGTSSHAGLARPQFEGVLGDAAPGTPLTICDGSAERPCYVGNKVPFYGLTDVTARLRYGVRLGLELQAARYVRFQFGSVLSWVTAHALTAAWPCNTQVDRADKTTSLTGGQCAEGIVNPAHRETIDLPGRRFWLSQAFLYDIYAAATAQF